MFERLKRLIKSALTPPPDDEPESVDHPKPRRANQNPPQRDWFARVSEKSSQASARREAKALDALDAKEPALSRDASAQVDALLAKTGVAPRR